MALHSVLITGGTGFLGSAVARAVHERHAKCKITVADFKGPIETPPLPSDTTFIQTDITSFDQVKHAIESSKPQVILHTAALIGSIALRYGRKESAKIWNVNVNGTRNVLDAAQQLGIEALVYTSSCAAVMDDLNTEFPCIDERWPRCYSSLAYGESKAAAEEMVIQASCSELSTCCLRPSVIFGPGDYQLIPSIYSCIAKGEMPYVLGSGYKLWDISYVSNIADAHVLAAENLISTKTAAGEVFFIQNNEPVPFRDFCLAVWAQFGHFPPYEIHIPRGLAYFMGWCSEMVSWLKGSVTTFSRGSVGEACSMRYASGEKAEEILGYRARVSVDEGLRLTCREYAQRIGVKLPDPGSKQGVKV